MGCDYYVYTDIRVTLDDGTMKVFRVKQERGYLDWVVSDDEETSEEIEARTLQGHSERKVIFLEGEWVIHNPQKYLDLIKETLGMHQVRQIEKVVYAEYR